MKAFAPSLLFGLSILLGGCLLPQPDTPGVPPGLASGSSQRQAAGGGAILPQPDTPAVPGGVALPRAESDAAFGGAAEAAGAPTLGKRPSTTSAAMPGVQARALPSPQALPDGVPVALGAQLKPQEMAALWPIWRKGQAWRYQHASSGSIWVLRVVDATPPLFEWRDEQGPERPARALEEGTLPTAPDGAASGGFSVAGVESLALASGSYGPCLVVESQQKVDGKPQRLRAWIAPGVGVVRQLWGPPSGGEGDQSWQLIEVMEGSD